jgi:hypothetical protein
VASPCSLSEEQEHTVPRLSGAVPAPFSASIVMLCFAAINGTQVKLLIAGLKPVHSLSYRIKKFKISWS